MLIVKGIEILVHTTSFRLLKSDLIYSVLNNLVLKETWKMEFESKLKYIIFMYSNNIINLLLCYLHKVCKLSWKHKQSYYPALLIQLYYLCIFQ